LMEFISYITGAFSYHNNWNIGYSIIFNCLMFPILILHYKKPLLAFLVCSILAFLLMAFFEIPIKITQGGSGLTWIQQK